jgi:hypothetical protein
VVRCAVADSHVAADPGLDSGQLASDGLTVHSEKRPTAKQGSPETCGSPRKAVRANEFAVKWSVFGEFTFVVLVIPFAVRFAGISMIWETG